jgi:hemoglobin
MGVPTAPARRRPIETVADVEELVRRFYQAAIPDPQLGPVFHAFGVDWSVHIPKLVAYWARELLGETGYQGNPVGAHGPVLDCRHFDAPEIARWLELWSETVDECFTGETAEWAKRRAGLAGQAIAVLARRHPGPRRGVAS